MKNLYLFIFTLLISTAFAGNIEKASIITPDLQTFMEQKSNSDLIRINIRFAQQLNLSTQYAQLQKLPMDVRRQTVVAELKQFAQESQNDIMSFLSTQSASDYKLVRQFWLANVITCYASENLIAQLAQRTDLDRIDIDEERQLIDEVPEVVNEEPTGKEVNEITYNVLKVNADDVWALGYTGEGIIVSVIDAGINYNHVDLADHMWTTADYPLHGYDFHNNDNDPMDGHGHGTHCAGTVAGDGTAGSQTGMAPDALLMGCKVLGDDGSGQESNVWAAIEFSVEQGANVISMSLGWSHSWNPDRPTWRTTLDNALAAGMVASIAAGNEGGSTSNPDDVRTPGDCPPPWLNPDQTLIGGISAVVCVGATNASDGIASFSSRGPVTWETIAPFNDYPFNPEMGLLRPDVSAPGVDVKSCNAFNINGYTVMSGTSMATPGVAGVMALLLSKNPGLTPEEICMILETTALDLGETGKDNVYGAGRVDALDAIDNTSEQGPVYESHVFNDPNANGLIEAGESIPMSVTMFNGSDMDFSNVDVTISTESPYITMTDDQENYGDFAVGEAIEIIDGFSFDVSENLPGMMAIRFNVVATDGTEVWESSFNAISYGPNLSIGNLLVDDAAGNDNGRLDPGETANLIIGVLNTGQMAAQDVLLQLNYDGNYLVFTQVEQSLDLVEADSESTVVFEVTVSPDANIGSVEMFNLGLSNGVFEDSKDFFMTIGLIVEDWESGDFNSYGWNFSGGDWFITDTNPYEGVYCTQSADIGDNGSTSMLLDYEVGADGTISFYYKVSSESGYDYLTFYIDNVEKGSWSGEVPWTFQEYEVTAGNHTFKWTYNKDTSVSNGSDAAWVDFIILPPLALPSINLEPLAMLCEGEQYMSEAQAENYTALLWTTSGDGSFNDEAALDAVYTPGTNDIDGEGVMLTLTAEGTNGNVSSHVNVTIMASSLDAPEIPMGSTTLCINPENQTYRTSLMEGYELTWTLSPVEAGEFEAAADSMVVMWADEFVGEASIQVKVSSPCAESDFSESLMVMVNDLPQMSIIESTSVCYGNQVEISAEFTGTAPWMMNVEGVGDISVEASPYMMSWTAMQDTSFSVNLLSDANGCINETSHTSTVMVNENPVVFLGNDTTVCLTQQVTLDAANEGASYEWSTGESSQTIIVDGSGITGDGQKEISVMVTNEFDCATEDMIVIYFQDCSGIGELSSLSQIAIYPNPNQGKFEVSFASLMVQDLTIEIYNLTGSIVYTENLKLDQGNMLHSIDLSDLSAQTYLMVLKTQEGQVVQRLVVE